MTFWVIGDEEPEDPLFIQAGPGACGLYFMAGAACMRGVRYRPDTEIPTEWLITDRYVRSWPNGVRLATRLVDVGLWVRVDGGYKYGWIQPHNTAEAVRTERESANDRQAKSRANRAKVVRNTNHVTCDI